MELLFVIFCGYIAQKIGAHFIPIKNDCAAYLLKISSYQKQRSECVKIPH